MGRAKRRRAPCRAIRRKPPHGTPKTMRLRWLAARRRLQLERLAAREHARLLRDRRTGWIRRYSTLRTVRRHRPQQVTMRIVLRTVRKSLLKKSSKLRKFIHRRVLSQPTYLFNRAYRFTRRLDPRDLRFHYRPASRFTSCLVPQARTLLRIRRTNRRKGNRFKYYVKRSRPAVVRLIPVHSRHVSAPTALITSRISLRHVQTFVRASRRLLPFGFVRIGSRDSFSGELQQTLFVPATEAHCRKLERHKLAAAARARRVTSETRSAIRTLLRFTHQKIKRWVMRKNAAGRVFWNY